MRRAVAAAALLAVGLGAGPVAAVGRPAPPPPAASAVLAVMDTGVNPYHLRFRDPSARARRHPSTYLPGYPRDAVALHLSLGERDYRTAVRRDCRTVWSRIRPGQLYWFPGTKIVGAITFRRGAPPVDCAAGFPTQVPILDQEDGHGTMVASRAVASGYGACPECRLVAVEGQLEGFGWAASHSAWIDAQSNSWGLNTPLAGPVDGLYTPDLVRRIEAASRRHLAFWASGNGVATSMSLAGHPTPLDPRLTPSAISVGGHDSGYLTPWSDAPPLLAADACGSPAAFHDSVDGEAEDHASGTSGATPFAAGGALRTLLAARRLVGDGRTGVRAGVVAAGRRLGGTGPLADGVLTLDEWRRVVLATATPRPAGHAAVDGPACSVTDHYETVPVRFADLPPAYPSYLHVGYGAIDPAAFALAEAVVAGRAPLPVRAEADAYFAADREIRQRFYDTYAGP